MRRFVFFLHLFFLALPSLLSAQEACESPLAQTAQRSLDKAVKGKKLSSDSLIFYLQNAQHLFEKAKCWEQVVRCSYNLCIAFERQPQQDTSRERNNLNRGLNASNRLSDTSLWRTKMHYISGRYYHERDYASDLARLHYELALQGYEKAKKWPDFLRTSRSLARLAHHNQDFQAMEHFLQLAYACNRDHLDNDTNELSLLLQLHGVLYYRAGNYQKALDKTQEALELVQKHMKNRADTLGVIDHYNNIGLYYIETGDTYKAEDYCNNALDLSLQLKDFYRAAVIYQNLAESFQGKGQWNKAIEYYEQALDISKRIVVGVEISGEDLQRLSINLNNGLAEAALRAERNLLSKECLDANLKIHQHNRFREEETTRILGEWYLAKNNYHEAEQYFRQSLALDLKLYGDKHPLVGRIYALLGDMEWQYGNTTQALEWYLSAEQALRSDYVSEKDGVSDKSIYLRILEKRARLLKSKPFTYRAAYQTSQAAVQLIDKMRSEYKSEGSKLFLQQRVIPIYELAIQMALILHQNTQQREYLDEAFRLLEKSKALLLLDALKTEEARAFGNVPDSLLAEERRLSKDIAQLEKQLWEVRNPNQGMKLREELLSLRQQASKLQAKLETNYPKYYELKYEDKTASLSQVQSVLGKESLLLEFFVGVEQVYIFGISKDSISVERITKSNTLEMSITALRTVISSPQYLYEEKDLVYNIFCDQAYDLYAKYLEKSLQRHPNIKRLVLIPDGMFNYLPFEVLLDSEIKNREVVDFRPLPYLLRKYIINYHYSATLMLYAQTEKRAARSAGILGFAPSYAVNPDSLSKEKDRYQRLIRSKVKELPGAVEELQNLQQTYEGDFFFGAEATEDRFKALSESRPYSVIHLAMHGWVDAEQPALSNLVFTYKPDSSKEDNLLHAYELNLLNLQADMVVLSACETGFGKYERGEGVVSLGRGFMYAGVPSLLMTLWPINDQATAYLMTRFYEALYQGLPKDEALRQAKLDYLEVAGELTAHPFFWASFVSLGQEQALALRRPFNWKNFSLYALLLLSLAGLSYLWWDKQKRKRAFTS